MKTINNKYMQLNNELLFKSIMALDAVTAYKALCLYSYYNTLSKYREYISR